MVSGWVCEAETVEIEIAGESYLAAYGTERLDTEDRCGDTDNGFGLLVNWNRFGEGGTHGGGLCRRGWNSGGRPSP